NFTGGPQTGGMQSRSNTASIGMNTVISAPTISVGASAPAPLTATSHAFSGAATLAAGFARALSLPAGSIAPQATVGDRPQLTATGAVLISASDSLLVNTFAGGGSLGLGAGVGASLAGAAPVELALASIGNAQVDTPGTISVLATSAQTLLGLAAAGSGGLVAAVAASIQATAPVIVVKAFTDT